MVQSLPKLARLNGPVSGFQHRMPMPKNLAGGVQLPHQHGAAAPAGGQHEHQVENQLPALEDD